MKLQMLSNRQKNVKETNGNCMKTVKGRVYPFMENQVSWHGSAPNDEQCEQAL